MASLPMIPDLAEKIALRAMAWIAKDKSATGRFLDMSGASPEDLRHRAAEPGFLGFALDFLLSDEALLLAFCKDQNLDPGDPMRARASLPGGDLPHWT